MINPDIKSVPAIEIDNLTVRYKDRPFLFKEFSMKVAPGEIASVCGESGCGKSTLLYCICGLIPRSIQVEMNGTCRLFGRPVDEYTKHDLTQMTGIVFQNPETQLFCDTVEDELAFGLENILLSKDEMSVRIDKSLSLAGLEKYRYTSPKLLSGGQKQLVILAAVLAMRPRILLLDEAFSQLDTSARTRLIQHISALRGEDRTIVLAGHDEESKNVADSIITLGEKFSGR
ncbi:MAG: energy-coupling factor ABC transporter ATP-binding protein [Oscillospiraceae bacterium]|nr:energy-coupling factor ABC transporter ATP-binding protein [Oscillospiraceae bacterium]